MGRRKQNNLLGSLEAVIKRKDSEIFTECMSYLEANNFSGNEDGVKVVKTDRKKMTPKRK